MLKNIREPEQMTLGQQDQKRKAKEQMETLLLASIDCPGQEVTSEYWQNLCSTVLGENSITNPSNT